jgi:hypothetical protein
MKIYHISFAILLAFFLGGCSVKDTPQPKTYPVPANTTAMNVDAAGKSIIIQGGINGWSSSIRPFLVIRPDGSGYIAANINFDKQITTSTNQLIDAHYMIKLPNLEVPDTSQVAKYYNYQTLLAHFKKGQQPLRGKNVPNGYMVHLSYIDQENMQNSFGYNSIDGDQEGSKWEIVEVKELGNNSILVRYEVDCKLYGYSPDTPTKVKLAGKLVGTIQTIVYYRPL